MDYYVYAGERGFWGRNAQYVSETKDAKVFTESEAIAFCKRRFTPGNINGPTAMPVLADHARQVAQS